MKANQFNICPSCDHRETCVLTDQKSQVWSCSEHEESIVDLDSEPQITSKENTTCQSELAMA